MRALAFLQLWTFDAASDLLRVADALGFSRGLRVSSLSTEAPRPFSTSAKKLIADSRPFAGIRAKTERFVGTECSATATMWTSPMDPRFPKIDWEVKLGRADQGLRHDCDFAIYSLVVPRRRVYPSRLRVTLDSASAMRRALTRVVECLDGVSARILGAGMFRGDPFFPIAPDLVGMFEREQRDELVCAVDRVYPLMVLPADAAEKVQARPEGWDVVRGASASAFAYRCDEAAAGELATRGFEEVLIQFVSPHDVRSRIERRGVLVSSDDRSDGRGWTITFGEGEDHPLFEQFRSYTRGRIRHVRLLPRELADRWGVVPTQVPFLFIDVRRALRVETAIAGLRVHERFGDSPALWSRRLVGALRDAELAVSDEDEERFGRMLAQRLGDPRA